MRTNNPFAYDWTQAPLFDLQQHAALRDAIRARLT
jgi:hypothetical protein